MSRHLDPIYRYGGDSLIEKFLGFGAEKSGRREKKGSPAWFLNLAYDHEHWSYKRYDPKTVAWANSKVRHYRSVPNFVPVFLAAIGEMDSLQPHGRIARPADESGWSGLTFFGWLLLLAIFCFPLGCIVLALGLDNQVAAGCCFCPCGTFVILFVLYAIVGTFIYSFKMMFWRWA
jgi:hypothetical protein